MLITPAPPAVPRSEARGPGGAIRPFTRGDIPAVVAIRLQAFRHTVRGAPEALAALFARTFLDNPWREVDLPSLVHLDESGAVNGFVGMVPRRMRFEGKLLRVACPTQLMVRPGSAAGAGLRLVRAVFEGPQDLTISDAANDAARRLWERVGGHTSHLHSLQWVLPLRPVRYALGQLGHTRTSRALTWLLRPVSHLLDERRAGPTPTPARGGPLTTERFDPARHAALLNEIASAWPLRPEYESAGLAWLLEETARKPDQGPLEAHLVRDQSGHAIGWFIYFANRGGVGEVVQAVARPGEQAKILTLLEGRARAAGLMALAGRMEPGLADVFGARGVGFTRTGPWFLTHARDPRLYATVLHGEGLLSRLEGEWWLNF